jgi:hypothetical protein
MTHLRTVTANKYIFLQTKFSDQYIVNAVMTTSDWTEALTFDNLKDAIRYKNAYLPDETVIIDVLSGFKEIV